VGKSFGKGGHDLRYIRVLKNMIKWRMYLCRIACNAGDLCRSDINAVFLCGIACNVVELCRITCNFVPRKFV
jgi:hypothetical protein